MMKTLHVSLSPDMHRTLKLLAAMNSTTIAEIVRAALTGAMQPLPLEIPPGILTRSKPPVNPQ